MTTYRIKLANGKIAKVDGPPGATEDQLMQAVAGNLDPVDLGILRSKNDPFGAFLRAQATAPVEGESDRDRDVRLGGEIPKPEVGAIEGTARSFLQGGSFGAGEEAVAAATAGLDTLSGRYPDKTYGELYDARVGAERDKMTSFRESNPALAMSSEIAGAIPTALLAAPRLAQGGTALVRALKGAGTGGAQGSVYGFNVGEGGFRNRAFSSATAAALGAGVGAFVPVMGAAAKRAFNATVGARKAAKEAGLSRPAYEFLTERVDADGRQAGQRLAGLGDDAMLADAGPSTTAATDFLASRPGSPQRIIGDALEDRVEAAGVKIQDGLNTALGKPGESSSRSLIVYGDKTNPLDLIYKKAYSEPIDYASEQGSKILELIQRVPARAINRAQELMDIEGVVSLQRMASIADDGTVTFSRPPDVRQIDYITRALNDEAFASAGQGALGGKTQLGGALSRLSGEMRGLLKELVPEYKQALNVAVDKIRGGQAKEFGNILLAPRTTRDEVNELLAPMGVAELRKVGDGLRQNIDDILARVKTAFTDPNMDAREAAVALKELSSRANRDKITSIFTRLGKPNEAARLFDTLDQASAAFQLKASVAQNSKTAIRQSFGDRFGQTAGPIGELLQAKPVQAGQRLVQALTGRTEAALRGKTDIQAAEIARALMRRGGAARETLGRLQAGQSVVAPRAENTRRIIEQLMRSNVGVTAPSLQSSR